MTELINLLKTLFINRTDVHAEQQPSGEYFKVDAPITDDLIQAHLAGKKTIGTYCLNKENKGNKICLDFDGESLPEIFELAKKACLQIREFDYSPLLEFSGMKGYHVWLFFEEAPASLIRALAEKISVGFKCEIFPKQDFIEEGGYGNLIKLPLGIHRESKRRSFFLDENFQPISLENSAALLKEKLANRQSLVGAEQKLLMGLIPEAKTDLTSVDKSTEVKPLPPKVESLLIEGAEPGNRHKSVFILAREMFGAGRTQEETLQAALEFNANCTPPKPEKTIERHITNLFATPKKYLQKTWEQGKAIAKKEYEQTGQINFPYLDNFDAEAFVSISLEEKRRIYLAVPCTVSEENEKGEMVERKSLRFLDEANKRGVAYDYSKAMCEDFFEQSAKIKGVQYRIWTKEPLTEPKLQLKGTVIDFRDYKKIGDRATVPVAVPVLIATEVSRPKTKVEAIQKFCEKINDAEAFKKNLFGVFRHPVYFEDLVSAQQLTAPHGYPLHLLWFDVRREHEEVGGAGRSDFEERLNAAVGNERSPFDMTAGTTKGLTISFRKETAEPGYLLETSCAFIDEIFAAIDKLQGRETALSEFFKELNGMLEWRNRLTKSGNTPFVSIRPRSRCFFAGNAPQGCIDLNSLANVISPPFLERVVPYCMTELHMSFLKPNRQAVDAGKEQGNAMEIETPMADWLEYVRAVPVSLAGHQAELTALKKVGYSITISDRTVSTVLSDNRLNSLYERRWTHHLTCLIDGLVKLRHLPELNQLVLESLKEGILPTEFKIKPNEADFKAAETILKEVLRSWTV